MVVALSFSTGTLTVYVSHEPAADSVGFTVTCALTGTEKSKNDAAAWNAYQYYKDGTIVEWTGDDDADTPHAITSIVDAAKLGHETVDAHGASTKQNLEFTRLNAAVFGFPRHPCYFFVFAGFSACFPPRHRFMKRLMHTALQRNKTLPQKMKTVKEDKGFKPLP